MFFLNADVIVADGGIRALSDIARTGKRAILAMGVRLIKENIAPYLLEHHRSEHGSVISISPRELVSVALPNLHPISKTHLFHGEGEGLIPAGLFWRVGEEGILARCFHLHPVMVYPKVKNAPFSVTIDDDYLMAACPDKKDMHVVIDSDEFCAFELSAADRRIDSLGRSSVMADIVRWAQFSTNIQHRQLVEHVIRIHRGRTNKIWEDIEKESDRIVSEVLRQLNTKGHLVELRQRVHVYVTHAQNYLNTEGIIKSQFPWSLFKVAVAGTLVGAYLALRSGIRACRRARQFLQG